MTIRAVGKLDFISAYGSIIPPPCP